MNGGELAYQDSGQGPPILFIHGMTFSGQTWDPIIERLRDRFRCIAVDLPGHGGSTGSAADLPGVCARVHATVRAAGIDAPLVVGHSAGALMATAYAATNPSKGVINIDQPLFVEPFARFVQHLEGALRGPDFAAAFAPFRASMGVDRLPEPERTRVVATQRIDASVVLDHWTTPLTRPPEALQEDVNLLLDRVTVPYLLVTGEPVKESDRAVLLDHIPSAVIEEWSGNGHMVHLVDPVRFAARVAAFAAESTGAETADGSR